MPRRRRTWRPSRTSVTNSWPIARAATRHTKETSQQKGFFIPTNNHGYKHTLPSFSKYLSPVRFFGGESGVLCARPQARSLDACPFDDPSHRKHSREFVVGGVSTSAPYPRELEFVA